MCLDSLDKRTKDFKYGWKVFRKYDGELYGQYYTNYKFKQKGYPINEWIEDVKSGKVGCFYYDRGFHFFKTRQDARDNCDWNRVVKKVLVENVVASGKQFGSVCGVAKRMKILDVKT